MALPTTRAEFKDYCLRKIGWPVIEVNVTEEQIDDRVDEALKYYADYHFDGSEKYYYKYQVTNTDKTNKYIEVPANTNIIGVTRMFNLGMPNLKTSDMFNINYQIALNELYTLTSVSLVPYYLAMEHLALIQEMLVGKQPIRYNRHMNRIYCDMNWDKIDTGNYLLFESYIAVDPATWSDVWADRWLQNYATVLITEQWGKHLTKFKDSQLISGNKFNGEKILDDAVAEKKKLEEEMIYTYSLPASDFVG